MPPPMTASDNPERLLAAAHSHLELALFNMCEQARSHGFGSHDRNTILAAASTLTILASQSGSAGLDSTSGDLDKLAGGPQIQEPLTVRQELVTFSQEPHEEVDVAKVEQEDQAQDQDLDESAIVHSTSRFMSDGKLASVSMNILPEKNTVSDMQEVMMDAFREVSGTSGSQGVPQGKVQAMTAYLGLRLNHIQAVFNRIEKTHDGLIYAEEFASISKTLLSMHRREEILSMLHKARMDRLHGQTLTAEFQSNESFRALHLPKRCFIISFKSRSRLVWDVFLMCLLTYVCIALPLTISFENLYVINTIDRVVDWLFFTDLLLNFRTTFVDERREEVWDAWEIASHYLKGWFLLDLVSSFPLEQISAGIIPRFQALKLFKFSKVAKASKMLRLGKMAKLWSGSELMDMLEEFVWEHQLVSWGKGWLLLVQVVLTAHWLACLLIACDGGAFTAYTDDPMNRWEQYVVALYWAMMTMTTVGYGDVVMKTDAERIYAIVAMIIGGAVYGYIIGVMTTLLSHHDMDQRAFMERMDVVVSWLNSHYELGTPLRRRVWRHFKEFLTATKAVDDSMVLNDLPPNLRNDVATALMSDSVRYNSLFENVSLNGLTRLVSSMSQVKFQANEVVVAIGAVPEGMFIVDRGFVQLETPDGTRRLCAGDSFGEEILMRDVQAYGYTVRTHSKVSMFRMLREDFMESFRDLPGDVSMMVENYYGIEQNKKGYVPQAHPGSSSLILGGPNGITPGFADVVLDHISTLKEKMDHLQRLSLSNLAKLNPADLTHQLKSSSWQHVASTPQSL